MWNKIIEKWKAGREKHPGWKGKASYLPAAVVFCAAAAALVHYQPVMGEEKNLSSLFAQYQEAKEADLLSAASTATEEVKETKEAETFQDGTYTGTGTGFGGQIKVQVTVKDQKITAIEILSASGEDSAFLQKAKGVIDSILAAQNPDVDTVSGATYSSRGIIAAVKNALYGTEDTNSTASGSASSGKTAGATPTVEIPANGYEDGTYTGTGTGFGGQIKVEVTIKNGKIKKVKLLEASGETASYLKKAKTLLNTIVEKQTPNVSAVSGATLSSNGIIQAVQNALKKAAKDKNTDDEEKSTKEESKKTESTSSSEDTLYEDGTYTGTGKGFRGNLTVQVKIKNGKITSIKVTDEGKDDKAFLDKAKAILDDMVEQQTAEVDTATGATYSSKGLIAAVKEALSKAKKSSTQTTEASKKKPSTEATTQKETTTDQNNETSTSQTEQPDKENTSSEATTGNAAESTTEAKSRYQDGTYTGKSYGFDGYIRATVVIQGGTITSITLTAESDEEWLPDVKDQIIADVLSKQSADGVDTVSGATYSSKGAIGAIQNALNQASNE